LGLGDDIRRAENAFEAKAIALVGGVRRAVQSTAPAWRPALDPKADQLPEMI